MKKLINESLDEFYSQKDFQRGDNQKNDFLGASIDFKGDFRLQALILKKLVRLKYQVEKHLGDKFNNQFDELLDALEQSF